MSEVGSGYRATGEEEEVSENLEERLNALAAWWQKMGSFWRDAGDVAAAERCWARAGAFQAAAVIVWQLLSPEEKEGLRAVQRKAVPRRNGAAREGVRKAVLALAPSPPRFKVERTHVYAAEESLDEAKASRRGVQTSWRQFRSDDDGQSWVEIDKEDREGVHPPADLNTESDARGSDESGAGR